jgi:hypothetical protein
MRTIGRLGLGIAIAILAGACAPASSTDRPTGSAPGATDSSPGSTSVASSNPNASPGTADIDFDYGPGTFNYLAPVSRLSGLQSYTSTLTLSFSGTEAGQLSEWSNTYTMVSVREPAARQLTFEAPSDEADEATVAVYRAEINGLSYERRGDAACRTSAVFAADALAERWEPATFLPGITGATESGTETVNGVAATRYDFDQRAFGSLPESASTGQIWIASEGGFVVRYLLTTTAGAEYFGDGSEGTLEVDYEVTDVNAAPAIALPAECSEQLPDAPMLPGATDVVGAADYVSYTTASSVDEAVAFYHDQLTALGWTSLSEPSVAETATIETFQRDGEQLLVIVSATDAGTAVRLTYAPIQDG